jgi:hypothetical protein
MTPVFEVIDRDGMVISDAPLAGRRRLDGTIVTADGRCWSAKGEWMDERGVAYPFPTIREGAAPRRREP